MDSLYPFFKWISDTTLGAIINDSKWLFPAIEGVHIVALALLFGVVLVLNLRLLGVMMPNRSLPGLARELEPWTLSSLVVILLTGVLLFLTEVLKSFHSTPFRVKMVLLFSAIVFHYAISRRLMTRENRLPAMLNRAAAVIAIALWVGVGLAGRAIAFF
jgi:uncharacterized protein DUF6644